MVPTETRVVTVSGEGMAAITVDQGGQNSARWLKSWVTLVNVSWQDHSDTARKLSPE